MDFKKSVNDVVISVGRAFTAKTVISVIFIGLFVPYSKLVYWLFDTAYLGGFGVNPDVFNRPVFSSDFVSVWLVAESMPVILAGWSMLALVALLVLTMANYEKGRRGEGGNEGVSNTNHSTSEPQLNGRPSRIFESLSKSIDWPAFIWVSGLLIIMFLALTVIWSVSKGEELSEIQRDWYLNEGVCLDKFSSGNVGCFTVSGVPGNNHFVIYNSDTDLIYMSRKDCIDIDSKEECKASISLNIVEKSSKTQYSVIRDYVPEAVD